ncbi:hypothetical protein [Buttiauxella sp. B2]|nr:hypothetical protein [Buttiauxella sp. B2]
MAVLLMPSRNFAEAWNVFWNGNYHSTVEYWLHKEASHSRQYVIC